MRSFPKIAILLDLILGCMCASSITPIKAAIPKDDAARLCIALSDKTNINYDAIIEILTTRTYSERQTIVQQELDNSCSGNSIKKLATNLNGLFREVFDDLLMPLPELYARELCRESNMKVRPSNVKLDILATASDVELNEIKNAYKSLKPCKKSLLEALKDPYRSEDEELDPGVQFTKGSRTSFEKAILDNKKPFNATIAADWFYSIGDLKNALTRVRGDERRTVKIFREVPIHELKAIIQNYEETYQHDFELAFKQRGFADDIEQFVLASIRALKSTPKYFADRLYDSLRGSIDPDDKALIRIIVGRSEIDLANIREEFNEKYGRSLQSVIESKNRDKNYLKMLAAIVSSAPPPDSKQ